MFNKRYAVIVLVAVALVYGIAHFWKAPGETRARAS
jgi:hypothetical protein